MSQLRELPMPAHSQNPFKTWLRMCVIPVILYGLCSPQVAFADSPPVLFAHSTIEMSDVPDCLSVRDTYYVELEMGYDDYEFDQGQEFESPKIVEVYVENLCEDPVQFTGTSPSGEMIMFKAPNSFDAADRLTLLPMAQIPEEERTSHRLRKSLDASTVSGQSLSFYRHQSDIDAEPTVTFTWALISDADASSEGAMRQQGVIKIASTLDVDSYPCPGPCQTHPLGPRTAPVWLIALLSMLAWARTAKAAHRRGG